MLSIRSLPDQPRLVLVPSLSPPLPPPQAALVAMAAAAAAALLAVAVAPAEAGKVLVLHPMHATSHVLALKPLLHRLAENGHQVRPGPACSLRAGLSPTTADQPNWRGFVAGLL